MSKHEAARGPRRAEGDVMDGTHKEHVKAIWKSAHAVNDFPGKWTIRRFSPYKKVCVVGEGETEGLAWENAALRIEKMLARP